MLPALRSPELFFGICSPVGTDNGAIAELLTAELGRYGYKTQYFKVTELMKAVVLGDMSVVDRPLAARYDSYINYANATRDRLGMQFALAALCSIAVRKHRRDTLGNPDSFIESQGYIFDQFKRAEEIDILRQVYGRLFVLVSVYSDPQKRIERLALRMARDEGRAKPSEDDMSEARALVARDEVEENVPTGQRLRDTFPKADLFINIDDQAGVEKLVKRFFEALFGSNSVSPTRDEHGIYTARNAALRSLDLSRQVGAALITRAGELIALGCNEVPSPNGGLYWDGDQNEDRDYRRLRGWSTSSPIRKAMQSIYMVMQSTSGSGLRMTKSYSSPLSA